VSCGVVLYGTSYNGVVAVDARTDATLSVKKVANSSRFTVVYYYSH